VASNWGSSDTSDATSMMSVCALAMTTPWRRTSSGSCGSASFTAFWTSTAARSASRSTSKKSWRLMTPLLVLIDL